MNTPTRLHATRRPASRRRAALLAGAAALAAAAWPAAPAHAQSQGSTPAGLVVPVKDWDVYVDLPTRFAFVKTPERWVFVRQLDEEQMTRLHPTTLTALLQADDGPTRYAHPALEPSPRVAARRDAQQRLAAAALALDAER